LKRRFKVTIDGETFLVEVEEVSKELTSFEDKPKVIKPAVETFTRAEQERIEDLHVVKAPLPGIVSDIRVAVGDSVDSGTVLLVLEAMKMENEIYSPTRGVVKEVYVSKGQQVARGDRLASIS